jgi:hypothetical protein
VIAGSTGRLKSASPALPGSTHDPTAAREHGIIDALADKGVMTFADKGSSSANSTSAEHSTNTPVITTAADSTDPSICSRHDPTVDPLT